MAEVAAVDSTGQMNGALIKEWTITGTDTGAPVELFGYGDKTVQFSGTFGAAVSLQGSIDGVNYVTLTDLDGAAISKTAAALVAVREACRFFRVGNAGTVTSVKVSLFAKGA